MTPEDIATIRHRRGFNIPWPVIASELGRTIQECREAIGLPQYKPAERQPPPWDQKQKSLFDQ